MPEYNYCPRCGQPLQDTFLHGRVRPTCPACSYVVYLDPKVGAGVVVELDGKVVLVRRGVNPMRGYWSLPSGYVERDESPDGTAVRETREETGLEVVLDGLLNIYSFPHEATGGRGVLVLYSARRTGGTLQAGDDADEVGAFGPDELPPDVAFETHRQALRDWQRAKAIVYRMAATEDAAAVTALNLAYRGEIGRVFDPRQVGDGSLFVAVQSGRVVGYAHLAAPDTSRTARLDQIFVLPDFRRWGVATRLVEEAVANARQRGLWAVLSQVPAVSPALLVYVKAGFRVVGFANVHDGEAPDASTAVLFLEFPLQAQPL